MGFGELVSSRCESAVRVACHNVLRQLRCLTREMRPGRCLRKRPEFMGRKSGGGRHVPPRSQSVFGEAACAPCAPGPGRLGRSWPRVSPGPCPSWPGEQPPPTASPSRTCPDPERLPATSRRRRGSFIPPDSDFVGPHLPPSHTVRDAVTRPVGGDGRDPALFQATDKRRPLCLLLRTPGVSLLSFQRGIR
ncbi:uncharacterized protein LOC115288693 [Suricata suricatta]|uniref:uncharacterized protein LOC115288693 n=1 Tax=Suricata suricatta TaxID=37032 RepID=UPI001155D41A|nr:uncharacterized protein LOC115288693 [Suricata suricatta]